MPNELKTRARSVCAAQHLLRIAMRIGYYLHRVGSAARGDALREADIALSVAKRQQNQLTVAYTPGMVALP